MCKRCIAEAVTRRHQKVKRILVDEAGGSCALCGYDRSVFSLHFHHVDPTTKVFGVSMATGKSLNTFRGEAAKCVLVCANCHGEIECGLIPSPPPQARYGEDWSSLPGFAKPSAERAGEERDEPLQIRLDEMDFYGD